MPDLTIRPATLDDLDEVLALRRTIAAEGIWIGAEAPLDEERDRASHRRTIEDGVSATMFIAVLDDRIVGSIFVGMTVEGVVDVGMAVADGHRGQGIGQRLIETGIDWARRAGAHKMTLQHWPWNLRARALYERVGFVEEGYLRRHYRRKDGSVWDAAVMGLVLDHDSPGHEPRAVEPPRR